MIGWRYLVAMAAVLGTLWGAYSFGVKTERTVANLELSTLKRAHEGALAALDRAHREALAAEQERARSIEAQRAADMAALDAQHTKEMQDAKDRFAADVAAVRDGAIRVRDRFTCQAPAAGPSGAADQAGGPTGMGDAATPGGLQAADIELVLRIGEEADEVTRQLSACQAIVRGDRVK